jgi:hypothetical protein
MTVLAQAEHRASQLQAVPDAIALAAVEWLPRRERRCQLKRGERPMTTAAAVSAPSFCPSTPRPPQTAEPSGGDGAVDPMPCLEMTLSERRHLTKPPHQAAAEPVRHPEKER